VRRTEGGDARRNMQSTLMSVVRRGDGASESGTEAMGRRGDETVLAQEETVGCGSGNRST
jgi:hypothetical protein